MEGIRAAMGTVRSPQHYDKVYNDECVYSFDTPFSENGLYVSLSNWQGVSKQHLAMHSEATGSKLYVHVRQTRTLKPDQEMKTAEAETMNDLLQASLPENKYDITEELAVVLVPEMTTVALPNDDLPMVVAEAANAVASHQPANDAEDVANMVAEEERPPSKYAESLVQLDNGVKISPDPSTWQCAESGMKENLWLNLSTGHIGSGRKNWDGSGGTNGALNHFEATGKQYPLVVKLGTITPAGADVYSYAEDEDKMVQDPKLAEHLAHWGINIMDLEKTEKTMAELELDLNKNHEFWAILEKGAKLTPITGPNLIGLVNLGNSCYMNSTLQMLLSPPNGPWQAKYGAANTTQLLRSAPRDDPVNDPITQVAKVVHAMSTGDYAVPPEALGDASEGGLVKPRAFKRLVGRNHPEFSTGRQQDAAEYFQHLLEFVDRAERSGVERLRASVADQAAAEQPLSANYYFGVQQRIECTESNTVRYKSEKSNILQLQVDLESAVNKDEVQEAQDAKRARTETGAAPGSGEAEEAVLPRVPLMACIDKWVAPVTMEDFRSPALGGKSTTAVKRQRIESFPPYLVVQAQRYYVDASWQPQKLEVALEVPDEIDLTPFRAPPGAEEGSPYVAGEKPMPEADDSTPSPGPDGAAPEAPQIDEAVLAQLVSMGFSENGCRRAILATTNDATVAMNWIFEHMADPDFNDPPPDPASATASASASSTASGAEVDPGTLAMLTSMGFSEDHVRAALQATDSNAERAADWLFSHADNLDEAVASLNGSGGAGGGAGGSSAPSALLDGSGRYRLRAMVSHIGKNTGSGHYVAHALKQVPGKQGEQWVIFNDQSVALSENPPREHAYLYFYERV